MAHLAEMHLVEHNLVGVRDAPESRDKREHRYDGQGELVVPILAHGLGARLRELFDMLLRRGIAIRQRRAVSAICWVGSLSLIHI